MTNAPQTGVAGRLTKVTASGAGGETVRLLAEFEVDVEPVAGDTFGLAFEDAISWLRRTLESADPEKLAGAEWETNWLRGQLAAADERVNVLRAALGRVCQDAGLALEDYLRP